MTRSRSTRSTRKTAPEEITVETPVVEEVTAETTEVEEPVKENSTLKKKRSADEIQVEIKEKLSKRSVEEDIFVPQTSDLVDKAGKAVAEEKGFEYNRGTAIGARLIARSQGLK